MTVSTRREAPVRGRIARAYLAAIAGVWADSVLREATIRFRAGTLESVADQLMG